MTVASASNFSAAAHDIAEQFTLNTGHAVRITTASTGMLYAQITNGAPFDLLLAADAERPALLEKSGAAVSGTRFTYALGELILWSRQLDDCRGALDKLENLRLAIANPDTAPYGAAAKAFLLKAGLWESVRPRLVVGENISQTLHFVASGNAALGFIARSQLQIPSLPRAACSWPVPGSWHAPIEQQAILLQQGLDNEAASQFLQFLRSDAGRVIIVRHGYRLPELSE
ncbi:MAG: molybdate ABC transporter substrate-binding protein [Woeseiaceae bacterium]|nr:molybdate ABC transporter substrate-binding protein [Woeseiaceae bacterium]